MEPTLVPRLGVIDLGTNTFHLLVAEPDGNGGFREVYRERRFVKLAEEGIETIGDVPYARGIETLRHFAEVAKEEKIVELRAIGTAALRTASNGPAFVEEAAREAGIQIQLISGAEEARLITLGVLQALPPIHDRMMLMDIGGGSVEFIICDSDGVYFQDSFPVGVAVLYKQFHRSEPIVDAEVENLLGFLREKLQPVREYLQQYPAHHLVGAAGTFDVVADILGVSHPTPFSTEVDLERFDSFYTRILGATRAERHAMDEVPPERADMIVVAFVLIRFVIEMMQPRRLTVSSFSMKEGILTEMLTGHSAGD